MHFYCLIYSLALCVVLCESLSAETALRGAGFSLVFDHGRGGVTSLKCDLDELGTEYLKRGNTLGNATLSYRHPGRPWRTVRLDDPQLHPTINQQSKSLIEARYSLPQRLELVKSFEITGSNLTWRMSIRNLGSLAIEIGDIALPLRMNTDYVGGDLQDSDAVRKTYQTRLNRHRLIAGHGSFFYWTRANGAGPHLVMTPVENTYLEYFDDEYSTYIHSARSGSAETRGSWRQPHTAITLAPTGQAGNVVNYGFAFSWANDYDGIREALYENGGIDVQVVPGMTVPSDLSARIALRTKDEIGSVQPEHPEEAQVAFLGELQHDVYHYEVKFSRLGENLIRVNYGANRHLLLEFFCTEPLEALYHKRSRFITENQQHRNDNWYNGLFSLWDMREQRLLGPEDTGGLQDYMVGGSDDPSNSKAVLVAEKNVVLPDANEIAALEYYLKNFVWGKLQRTDQEHPHPYGIYGSENWYLNRTTRWGTTLPDRIQHYEKAYGTPHGTGLGAERLWRSFDYTTFIMLYYNMHRIAKEYPHLVEYLDADGYLDRAFGTAKAYFQVPYSIHMIGKPLWSHKGYSDWAYKLGNFHERYIIDLIRALHEEDRADEAEWLRNEWEKKVKYFLYDDPYPFGSEFVFDRTAFESTHAVAKYAIDNPLRPDKNLWFDRNLNRWYSHPDVSQEHAVTFMKRQIDANMSMRGSLEPAYYYLGSARVGNSTLDYMSQMAGWAALDYGLYFSEDPVDYIRLGYASLLSSWALMNSGSAKSGFGYWYPGEKNDGAVGWNFQSLKHGRTWGVGNSGRGSWPVDGEIDHGLAGGIKAAATVVLDDPIFGRIALGGSLSTDNDEVSVIPQDGVRRRLHFLLGDQRIHLLMHTDGFKKTRPIVFDDKFSHLSFQIENRSGRDHDGSFEITGLPDGEYEILIDGQATETVVSQAGETRKCSFHAPQNSGPSVLIKRK